MPRHRKSYVSRHGTHRVDTPARRVGLLAAEATPDVMPVGGDEPETVDFRLDSREYQPRLRAIRLNVIQRGLRGRRGRTAGRPLLRTAARSLLVTPWFAAGAGIVLAAGLWIYSPHTELKFPANATNPAELPCLSPGCGPGPVSHPNGHTASKPGVRMRHRHEAAADGQKAATDLTFRFTKLWQRRGMFGAVVSVSGPNLPSSWRLTFNLPGAKVRHVLGALWLPAADGSGGTAYPLGAGTPNGTAAPFGSASQQAAEKGSISFLVLGSGSPGTPTGCVFNHASCTFS